MGRDQTSVCASTTGATRNRGHITASAPKAHAPNPFARTTHPVSHLWGQQRCLTHVKLNHILTLPQTTQLLNAPTHPAVSPARPQPAAPAGPKTTQTPTAGADARPPK